MSGEVVNGGCEFSVVESSQHNRSGIARIGASVCVEDSLNPVLQSLSFCRGRLMFSVLRWHLLLIQQFDGPLPRDGIAADIGDGSELFEIQIALLFRGGMAVEAELLQSRQLLCLELRLQGSEGVASLLWCGIGRDRQQQNSGDKAVHTARPE